MKLVSAHSPVSPVSPTTFLLCWTLVVVFVVMVSLQLITYEKFVPIIQNYQLFDNSSNNKIFAALIVIAEVLALPFLLRMRLSRLMRFVSAGSLIFICLSWVTLGLFAILANSQLIGTGLFGGFLNPLNSYFVLAYALFLSIGSVVAIWRLRNDFELSRN